MIQGNPMLDWLREKTNFVKHPVAHFLKRLGFKPNYMTGVSFLCGTLGVYFLFSDHVLFIIFASLHLLIDLLDGSLARITQTTSFFGKWADYLSDGSIALFLLVKSLLLFPQTTAVVALYIIHHFIYIMCKGKIIVFPSRSFLIFCFFFELYGLGIIISGILSGIGILAQILHGVNALVSRGK